jgi:murein DD-endopeptidase MepM/ murein hydrolase activator NlpD
MHSNVWTALALAPLLLAPACRPGQTETPPEAAPVGERRAPLDTGQDALRRGRDDTERFYSGNLVELHDRMTPALREEAGSAADLGDFRRKVTELAGREADVLSEETFAQGELTYYRRVVRFDGTDEVMAVVWGYAQDGAIEDFTIRPVASPASVEYETRTPLRLPFDGEWYVTSGGRTPEQNQHTRDYSNRFAYDIVLASELEDTTTRREPSDHATWGQPILAPAAGVVAGVLGDVADNPLSVTEGEPAIGNHVVIDHGNGEFSVLGHLQRGSLRVSVGDSVEAGRVIGRVGNSGNSNGSHLHFNLQDGPEPNAARGLPAQFLDYVADGERVARGEPVRGQVVRDGGR